MSKDLTTAYAETRYPTDRIPLKKFSKNDAEEIFKSTKEDFRVDEKEALIQRLRHFRQTIDSEIPINRMIFFGSFAKGKQHKWSDIDLIIVSSRFRRVKSFKRARKLYDYWNLDYPVDFLCYTPEEFNKLKGHFTVVRQALKEGIEIY